MNVWFLVEGGVGVWFKVIVDEVDDEVVPLNEVTAELELTDTKLLGEAEDPVEYTVFVLDFVQVFTPSSSPLASKSKLRGRAQFNLSKATFPRMLTK